MSDEPALPRNDAEIAAELTAFIERDKARTQEERDEFWREHKLAMYREQLERQLKYLDSGVPSLLIAMNAINQYGVARSLWEEDVLRIETDHERDRLRRASGRCVRCARALPLPYEDGQHYCPSCDKEINESITEYAEN